MSKVLDNLVQVIHAAATELPGADNVTADEFDGWRSGGTVVDRTRLEIFADGAQATLTGPVEIQCLERASGRWQIVATLDAGADVVVGDGSFDQPSRAWDFGNLAAGYTAMRVRCPAVSAAVSARMLPIESTEED